MKEPFSNYRQSVQIKHTVRSAHISVGDHTYYAGYYHGRSFEDCVMYLDELDDCFDNGEVDRLEIGKFCSIASGVLFVMGGNQNHDPARISCYPLDWLRPDHAMDRMQSTFQRRGDTVIGNDVWLGAQALVMPGVTVGDGAVIGAGSVVTKAVGPYEIWAGNPARRIRTRFSDAEIEMLLQVRWWDLDLAVIRRRLDLIQSTDVRTLHTLFRDGRL